MSTSTSAGQDAPREHRLLSKHKWRGKLFKEKEDKQEEKWLAEQQAKDQNIAQFLGSSSTGGDDRLLDTHLDPRPDAASDGASHVSVEDGSLPPPPKNIYHRARPRQNKGLQVHFTPTAPEIIGEGGDEAETPASMVSAIRRSHPEFSLSIRSANTPALAGPSPDPFEDPPAVEAPAPRGETSLRASEPEIRLRRRSVQDIGDVHPIALQGDRSSQDGLPSPVSPVSPLSDDGDFETALSPVVSRDGYAEAQSGPPSNNAASANSLTPQASPEPTSLGVDDRAHSTSQWRSSSREPSPSTGALLSPSTVDPRPISPAAPSNTSARSLRKVAKNLGGDAIDDFDARVNRFYEVFRLGVTATCEVTEISFRHWLITAKWWFLRGRAELELEVRSKNASSDGMSASINQHDISPGLKQAYLDLAKAWWIVKEVTPNHPDIRRYGNTSVKTMVAILRNFGNRELANLAESHVDIVANVRALAMSMKRNARLPNADFEIQNLNTKVLFEPAVIPTEADFALHKHRSARHPRLSMPLGDSPKHFAFTRMFGKGSVVSRSRSWEPIPVPCMISLLRSKGTLDLTAAIVSPDDVLELIIQMDESHESELTWKTINWSSSGNFISIPLSEAVDLAILLTEYDFKALWSICDYNRKVQKDFNGRRGEEILFQATLDTFQCLRAKQHASSFPPDPVAHCHIRLFDVIKTFDDGTGRLRAGRRLMARTPPEIKTLSSISQDYGNDMPTLFGFGRRDESPKLSIRVPGSSTLVLAMRNWEEMDEFYSTFTQRRPALDEYRSQALSLQRFQISTEDPNTSDLTQHLQEGNWQHVRVITKNSQESQPILTFDRSQHLRLIAQGDKGILTDCLGLAPGELQMSLSIHDCNEISLRRPPQRDLFVSLTDYGLRDEDIDLWRNLMWSSGRSNTIKSYTFRTVKDLQTFQSLVLGFEVIFEGVASSFAISRRRKGVPLHKQWEADFARVQILRHDRSVQLVAFFKDFTHGSSMNFVLKSTDVFEKSDKQNEHFIRIVDAKFALPKGPEDPARNFVCLDTPEYPSEHDDISIGFKQEQDRDKFALAMPAAVSKASKLSSLKR